MSIYRTRSTPFDWHLDSVDWPVTTEVGAGLSGVIAATTEVMWLDPAGGRLSYRGEPVETLAGRRTFEEVAYLLITAKIPEADPGEYRRFRDNLRASRRLPDDVIGLVREMDRRIHPTRLLRAGVSALGCHELTVNDDISGERQWHELRIVGQVAALVAEIACHLQRRPTPAVDDETSLASGVLAAFTGIDPDLDDVGLLDTLWVLYAAHGLDAPTFTSMVVASCHADPYYNVVAGLSALRGPRQGGASEAVLHQLDALDSPSRAEAFVNMRLSDGLVVAGFGHRSYRMQDPRVVVLRRELASLAGRKDRADVYERALALENAATAVLAPRGVHININFYAAPIFALLGAAPPLVPCLYAIARTAGMVALVREAERSNRLIRPLTRYIGAAETGLGPEEAP